MSKPALADKYDDDDDGDDDEYSDRHPNSDSDRLHVITS